MCFDLIFFFPFLSPNFVDIHFNRGIDERCFTNSNDFVILITLEVNSEWNLMKAKCVIQKKKKIEETFLLAGDFVKGLLGEVSCFELLKLQILNFI